MSEKSKKDNHGINKSEVALTEERILARWKEKDIFKKTLEKTKDGKPFVFYDGPPFATGEPHYGHILTGTIKDAIPRYQTMKGRYVRRQWGWDCHGLPIENIIEDELKLGHKKDIEEYGIGNFNEAARRAVLRYDSNWKEFVPRSGRFVDMEASYKTMDATYTESIWWAFKTLYDKGLAYEGHKIMYVCPRCETSLSNFEVAQGYKDIADISVTVKFELLDANIRMETNDKNEGKTFLLAWTTTPWTLPGNTALAVGKNIEYVKITYNLQPTTKNEFYILAKERLGEIMGKEQYEIISEFKGSNLIGKSYKPLFDYYSNDRELLNHGHGWKIYGGDFVTTESGTGIVHIAPAFGEDDMNLARQHNLPVVQHVSLDGKFKPEVKDFAGQYVKQKGDTQSADVAVLKYLAGKGVLFSKEKVTHSYPLCWRCDTPLINYAIDSWFVKVTEIRDKVVAENKKIGWVPEHVGEGRFGKWLEGARDWAISRTRYWGAPLPVWRCAECDKMTVFGGVKEFSEKLPVSGNKYFVMRHGQSEFNASGRVNSDPEREDHLTGMGEKQVIESVERMKENGVKIDRIISSDYIRARDTAKIVADILEMPEEHIVFDPRFREISTGVFQDKPNDEYHNFTLSYIEKFIKAPEGGENLMDVKHRVIQAMRDLEKTYRNQTILLINHEYTAWMLYAAALGISNEEAVKVKEERDKERGHDFLRNAEYEELKWKLIPRNLDGELDFHRPYIDEVIFGCECGGTARRIQDVFDCWFESGSMPYAQFHYPFENEKEFKRNFPADFIAEGMDQTRGWFYSLIMLGVGLFGRSPYKNVIVNGTVLAEDGQKMSKRLKNYPDPAEIINKYGADALRYYLLSSPIMRGEDLSFLEKGLDEVYKKNIVRLNNIYSFYKLYRGDEEAGNESEDILDKWIITRLNQLILETSRYMDAYELDRATKPVGDFIDDFSTWYIRRSRDRFKSDDETEKKAALSTTKYVLEELSKVLAPFMPFIADDLYMKVTESKKEESVHLEKWPGITDNRQPAADNEILEQMEKVRKIVTLGLEARAKHGIKVRQPLQSLKLKTIPSSRAELTTGQEKLKIEYLGLIQDEINVKEIIFDGKISGDVELDTNITPELKEEGDVRDLIRSIQEWRKKEGLTPSDRIDLGITALPEVIALIKKNKEEIKRVTLLSDISTVEGTETTFNLKK